MAAVTLASASPAPKPHSKGRNGDRVAAGAAERQLLLRYHRWGDLSAREELVEFFLPPAATSRCATRTPTSRSTTYFRWRASA